MLTNEDRWRLLASNQLHYIPNITCYADLRHKHV